MIFHSGRSLLSSLLFALLFPTVGFSQIIVGPNVQVSKANADRAHFEVLVAADPIDPGLLLGCSMIAAREPSMQRSNTVVYRSIDGGINWQPTLEVDQGFAGSADPACTLGIDNSAYFATLILESGNPFSLRDGSRMTVYRSLNAGRNWQSPVDLPMVDREHITVDTTGSRYRGNVYINAHGFARPAGLAAPGIFLSGPIYFRSLNGGQTFSYPRLVIPLPFHRSAGQPQSAVLSDGTLVAAYVDVTEDADGLKQTGAAIHVTTSCDGGDTFSRVVIVPGAAGGGSLSLAANRGSGSLSLAADRGDGPFRDHIYLAWTDSQSGRDQILLIKSSDKGKTWSLPVVINDDAFPGLKDLPNGYMPVVAVNDGGVVGVMWYDNRGSNDEHGYSVRFTASLDGGETFVPSVRVSEVSASYEIEKWQFHTPVIEEGYAEPSEEAGRYRATLRVDLWSGHYAGMAAGADRAFHPFWVDNRTGLTQVWTATIRVPGRAIINGTSDLADWQDLTPKLTLQLMNPRFDSAKRIASIDAYLVNRSNDPIHGPLKLRFLSMKSEMGDVKLIESANSFERAGAIKDVDEQIPKGTLNPGARTDAIRLRFSVSDPRLVANRTKMVRFEAKVLGMKGESIAKPTLP
jgi:hypothetical protein